MQYCSRGNHNIYWADFLHEYKQKTATRFRYHNKRCETGNQDLNMLFKKNGIVISEIVKTTNEMTSVYGDIMILTSRI